MKRIIRLTESDLTRIVKRVIRESNYLTEGYTQGHNVSFLGKTYKILYTDTTGCQRVFIQLQEMDKDNKPVGNILYYYVTRAGAMNSLSPGQIRVSDSTNTTKGAVVSDVLQQTTLGTIALESIKQKC